MPDVVRPDLDLKQRLLVEADWEFMSFSLLHLDNRAGRRPHAYIAIGVVRHPAVHERFVPKSPRSRDRLPVDPTRVS